MRGKVFPYCISRVFSRITPARAGKRTLNGSTRRTRRDHPRACGEKGRTRWPSCANAGSPPRVRGKAPGGDVFAGAERITPARAGKRHLLHGRSRAGRDHPRACGEKSTNRRAAFDTWGSPPRVRGKVKRRGGPGRAARITPARAGKRRLSAHGRAALRDHPRACGEKRPRRRHALRRQGSPPRVRGKELHSSSRCVSVGITPARAGKRSAP